MKIKSSLSWMWWHAWIQMLTIPVLFLISFFLLFWQKNVVLSAIAFSPIKASLWKNVAPTAARTTTTTKWNKFHAQLLNFKNILMEIFLIVFCCGRKSFVNSPMNNFCLMKLRLLFPSACLTLWWWTKGPEST